LTGKYPHRTGAVDVSTLRGYDRIAEDEVLLPSLLKQIGYATGLVGKWHNGRDERKYHPTSRGFDEFVGFCSGGCDYWDWYIDFNGEQREADGRYLTDVFTDEAVSFIERHSQEAFFLQVAFNAPHTPLQAFEEDREEFEQTGKFTPAVNTIYAMIKRMDRGIGRILECLDASGIAEETIILFTSDNGPDMKGSGERSAVRFNGMLNGSKGVVLEGGIRVPAIVRWPNRLPQGRVCDTLVHFTDWVPTLLEAAGGTLPVGADINGSTVLAALSANDETEQQRDRTLYWQWNRFVPLERCNAAVTDGEWKLVYPSIPEAVASYKSDGPIGSQIMKRPDLTYELVTEPVRRELSAPQSPQLYHLVSDPYERHDVSAANPDRTEQMMAQLEHWFRQMSEECELKHRMTLNAGNTI
jgi:arylsulfatase A